jgi:hypothetical protein
LASLTVFAGVSLVIFICLVVVAVMGFRSPGKANGDVARLGPGQPGRPVARPRAWRASRRDRDECLLPADATVTFAAERRATETDEVLGALGRDLVGLLPVKKKVEEIAALLLVDRARRRFGLDSPRPNMHMCFTGPQGTGKTTVALRMAELLHRLGYLEQGQLVQAMRDDLVGEYVGQTAPRTKRVLERAKGGVLFIDEAYYLYRATDSKDYGQEAIDILLQVMENERDKARGEPGRLQGPDGRVLPVQPGDEFPDRPSPRFRRLRGGRAGGDRAADAQAGALLPVRGGGTGLPPLPCLADHPAPVRQRPERPQRGRACPAAPR